MTGSSAIPGSRRRPRHHAWVGRGAAVVQEFGLGLLLSIVLVYLVLMAQFASFVDRSSSCWRFLPDRWVVNLPVDHGRAECHVAYGRHHDDRHRCRTHPDCRWLSHLAPAGMPIDDAVALACMRLRPVLMTSLATILGLIPTALALEGQRTHARARSIIGGLMFRSWSPCSGVRGVPVGPSQEEQPTSECRRERQDTSDSGEHCRPAASMAAQAPKTRCLRPSD